MHKRSVWEACGVKNAILLSKPSGNGWAKHNRAGRQSKRQPSRLCPDNVMSVQVNEKGTDGRETSHCLSTMRWRGVACLLSVFAVLFCGAVPANALLASSNVTIVTTAEELKAALDGGVLHVHITKHLDLTALPGNIGEPIIMFKPGPSPQSVTVCLGLLMVGQRMTHVPPLLWCKPNPTMRARYHAHVVWVSPQALIMMLMCNDCFSAKAVTPHATTHQLHLPPNVDLSSIA
jgi:hypothetical protein